VFFKRTKILVPDVGKSKGVASVVVSEMAFSSSISISEKRQKNRLNVFISTVKGA
jgi:hypothetical protein